MLPLSTFPGAMVPSPEPVSSAGSQPMAGVRWYPNRQARVPTPARVAWVHTYTKNPQHEVS